MISPELKDPLDDLPGGGAAVNVIAQEHDLIIAGTYRKAAQQTDFHLTKVDTSGEVKFKNCELSE